MRITDRVHALRIPFSLPVGPGKTLERFVYAYIILGKEICLIDSGVSGSAEIIFDYLRSLKREPDELKLNVLTHAHPDHIGGAREIRKLAHCLTAAHPDAAPWIEDTERQFAERPVPGFRTIVGGPVKIETLLRGGDTVDLGEGYSLEVIDTPGHARGHIALHCRREGALFSGDAVPAPGSLPIYEDAVESMRSIRTIQSIRPLSVLLSSWDEPRTAGIRDMLAKAAGFLQKIHSAVLNEMAAAPSAGADELAPAVLRRLGIPEYLLNPVLVRSVRAHMDASAFRNLEKIRVAG